MVNCYIGGTRPYQELMLKLITSQQCNLQYGFFYKALPCNLMYNIENVPYEILHQDKDNGKRSQNKTENSIQFFTSLQGPTMTPRETCLSSRFTFNTRFQGDRESLVDFVRALKILSSKCQFGTDPAAIECLVRDQFIVGIRNKSAQAKILEGSQEFSLDEVLKIGAESGPGSVNGGSSLNLPEFGLRVMMKGSFHLADILTFNKRVNRSDLNVNSCL